MQQRYLAFLEQSYRSQIDPPMTSSKDLELRRDYEALKRKWEERESELECSPVYKDAAMQTELSEGRRSLFGCMESY